MMLQNHHPNVTPMSWFSSLQSPHHSQPLDIYQPTNQFKVPSKFNTMHKSMKNSSFTNHHSLSHQTQGYKCKFTLHIEHQVDRQLLSLVVLLVLAS